MIGRSYARVAACTITALLLLSAALPAAAQMPPGKWWKDPDFQRDLALTDDQQRDIEALFAQARDSLIDLRGQVQKSEGKLEDAFDARPFDERAAHAAADDLEQSRSALVRAEIGLQIGVRKLLTDEQFGKLKKRMPRPDIRGEGRLPGPPPMRGRPSPGGPGAPPRDGGDRPPPRF